MVLEEFAPEPTDLVVGRPEFAGLVDVDLACLLGVCLAELLAYSESVETSLEDASLAAQICCGRKTERSRESGLGFVQQLDIWIGGEVAHLALPICL